jgi:hypothetical protein
MILRPTRRGPIEKLKPRRAPGPGPRAGGRARALPLAVTFHFLLHLSEAPAANLASFRPGSCVLRAAACRAISSLSLGGLQRSWDVQVSLQHGVLSRCCSVLTHDTGRSTSMGHPPAATIAATAWPSHTKSEISLYICAHQSRVSVVLSGYSRGTHMRAHGGLAITTRAVRAPVR